MSLAVDSNPNLGEFLQLSFASLVQRVPCKVSLPVGGESLLPCGVFFRHLDDVLPPPSRHDGPPGLAAGDRKLRGQQRPTGQSRSLLQRLGGEAVVHEYDAGRVPGTPLGRTETSHSVGVEWRFNAAQEEDDPAQGPKWSAEKSIVATVCPPTPGQGQGCNDYGQPSRSQVHAATTYTKDAPRP